MTEREPLISSGRDRNAGSSDLQLVAERATSFNNEVAQLARLADQIGSFRDTEQLRKQLRIKREDCATLAKSTLQTMKKLKIDRSEKVKYDKMMSQINDIFNRCQKISQESIEKERVTPLPTAVTVEENLVNTHDEQRRDAEKTLKTLQYQSYNVDHAIIEERDNEMKFLENELHGLNEMFVDIAQMIKEQGEDIITIDDNTQKANSSVEDGVKELQKASEYQKSSRNKLCCLALIIVIVLAAIGIFLGIWFGALKH